MHFTVNVPSEFNTPSNWSEYEIVYLRDAVSAIQGSLPNLIPNASDSNWTISCFTGPNNNLSVKIAPDDDKKHNIPELYQLHNIALFFVKIMSVDVSSNQINLELNVLKKHDHCFHRSILDVARHAQDEIRFLLDHEQFWSFRAKEVISHLTSEHNLLDPRVLAKLPEFVNSDNLSYREAALSALELALNAPQIKEIAKALIIKLAQPREEKFTTYWQIRLSALTVLSKLLHEPDVHSFFKNIIQNDERYAARTHALNLVEKLSDAELNYRDALYQKMITKLLPQSEHDSATIFSLEFCIWSNPIASGSVFRSGSVDINWLVNLFRQSAQLYPIGVYATRNLGFHPLGGFAASINQTSALYSILKCIAYTCDDIELFNLVTTPLIDIAADNRLGLLEPIGELLDDVCKNPKIEPPQEILDLRKPRVPNQNNNEVKGALLGSLNREREYSVFKKIRVQSLYELIGDSEIDANVRIVAIRDCQQYLFTIFDKKEYEGYCNQLMPQLYRVAENTNENMDVRRAADQILTWYSHVNQHTASNNSSVSYVSSVGIFAASATAASLRQDSSASSSNQKRF